MLFVNGYHGTSEARANIILSEGFRASTRRGLWLGTGVYFFVDAPDRATDYARSWGVRAAENVVVLRATISLENCVDLIDSTYWGVLRDLYATFEDVIEERVQEDLSGKPIGDQIGFQRYLEMLQSGEIDPLTGFNVRDCHLMNLATGEMTRQGVPVHSIRAAFAEGRPIHPSSWLFDESAVTVCVKEISAIQEVTLLGP